MKRLSYKLVALIVPFLLLTITIFAQEERVLNYDVIIEVMTDRSIKVKEDFVINVTGQRIKRGITRGLPKFRQIKGKNKPVNYNITKVTRDGQREGFHTASENGEKMMYIGKREVILKHGQHQYTIEYTVSNQVEQLPEIDEIYWNAVGHYFQFPVDQVSCLVRLPKGANHLQKACYTGKYGRAENNCEVKEVNNGNELYFQTTQPLAPFEGMTVGVGFEKGIVQGPSFLERYGSALLLCFSALGLLGYFITTWNKYGIDPPKPTPYPQFASPQGYSPSSLSYIAKESYRSNKVTSSIINLAINGYLRIDEEGSSGMFSGGKTYQLTQLNQNTADLYPEDKALMERLFASSSVVNIDGKYASTVKKAYEGHQNSILAQHEGFINEGNNRQFLAVPIIVSFATVIAAALLMNRDGSEMNAMGLVLLSTVFIALPGFVLFTIFSSKGKLPRGLFNVAIPFLFFFMASGSFPLLAGLESMQEMVHSLFNGASINVVALVLFVPLAIISIVVYAYLIKQPTQEKLQLQSDIEGFKMYLEMAEKDRMNLLNPPDRTPEHFEAMLPFAFALGVEHKWSSIFKNILEAAAYQPNWSNNRHIYVSNSFSSDFSNSMVQSSTPPPPSGGGGGFGGGSGGGGFSGGGGGGGSMGGW